MNSALDDIIAVLDFLMSSKTPTTAVGESLERLHKRGHIPVDVKVSDDYDGRKPKSD